jgi:deoxyribodipyrimidine photolyase-related protein
MLFLILPNQLFDIKYLNKSYHYLIWECPHFFKAYKYNKKKLVLHRASMKYYYDYLTSNGFKVSYIEFVKVPDVSEEYILFNPLNKPEILSLPSNYQTIDSPSLLLSQNLSEEYRKKTKKFFFNAFYMWSKKQFHIIPGIKSQDKDNRQTLKQTTIAHISQPFENTGNNNSVEYIREAAIYVNKHFGTNYGTTDNFMYPVTHKDAKHWLEHFIKHKFKQFGPYQDYINKDDPYLYHSLLSALLNIGLLCPGDIVKQMQALQHKIPINSYEGFIRQLFWREYQYYCYTYSSFNRNYFGNQKKLTAKWYNGTTGILPVDDAIKEAFSTGYLHHIKRLMVIGNFMNLSGIHPKEGFRWFMEFSCDSYEWVMHQNVYDMVFFVNGGENSTMRRPYISASNYVLKMSNYPKAEWCGKWDALYRAFVAKNKQKLWKFRYFVRLE